MRRQTPPWLFPLMRSSDRQHPLAPSVCRSAGWWLRRLSVCLSGFFLFASRKVTRMSARAILLGTDRAQSSSIQQQDTHICVDVLVSLVEGGGGGGCSWMIFMG